MAVLSVFFIEKTILMAITNKFRLLPGDSMKIGALLFEKKELEEGPKVVVIGGGTGLSTMLRGIKKYTSNITAVVTVADDGGGSGILREDLGILAPGDIRNCIMALSEAEPIMQKLLQYRFTDGMLKGQNFGNLFLAAMNGIYGGFGEAVRKMSDVLAVRGDVLPVTLDNVKLCAELEDSTIVHGESNIGKVSIERNSPIFKLSILPEDAKPAPDVLEAIENADVIILGPGSLYTSIIPNLLVKDVAKYIKQSAALKVYICNIMTQPGETIEYNVYEHIDAIEKHAGEGIIDWCIANKSVFSSEIKKKYKQDGATPVVANKEKLKNKSIQLLQRDLVSIKDDLIRHDPDKLADAIMELIIENNLAKKGSKLKIKKIFHTF